MLDISEDENRHEEEEKNLKKELDDFIKPQFPQVEEELDEILRPEMEFMDP